MKPSVNTRAPTWKSSTDCRKNFRSLRTENARRHCPPGSMSLSTIQRRPFRILPLHSEGGIAIWIFPEASSVREKSGVAFLKLWASRRFWNHSQTRQSPSRLDFPRIRGQIVDNTTLVASQGILNWRFDNSGKELLVGNNPTVHSDDEGRSTVVFHIGNSGGLSTRTGPMARNRC